MFEIKNLQYKYRRGTEPIFENFNHLFQVGTITAVTGESGTGKSTLLYILGLLLKPQQGEIKLNGMDCLRLDDKAKSQLRAKEIGFIFQDFVLNPKRSTLDAICEPAIYADMDKKSTVERAYSLAKRLGVEHRLSHRPVEISGGQAQRIALARALINNPTAILADEPTGNLDSKNSQIVLELLQAEAQNNRTIIVATHDKAVLELATEIVQL